MPSSRDARKRKEELLGDRDAGRRATTTATTRPARAEARLIPRRGATLRIDMDRALAVLSDGERAAIVQCYHNDLSHEEAAIRAELPRRHREDAHPAGEAEAQVAARGMGDRIDGIRP